MGLLNNQSNNNGGSIFYYSLVFFGNKGYKISNINSIVEEAEKLLNRGKVMIRLRLSANLNELNDQPWLPLKSYSGSPVFVVTSESWRPAEAVYPASAGYYFHCIPKITPGLFVGIAFVGGVIVTGWLNLLRSTSASRAIVAFEGSIMPPLALGVPRELRSAFALTFSSAR